MFSPEDLGGNRHPVEVLSRLAKRGHEIRGATSGHRVRLKAQYPWADFFTYPRPTGGTAANHLAHLKGARAQFLNASRGFQLQVLLLASYEVAAAAQFVGCLRGVPSMFFYHSELYSDYVNRVAKDRRPAKRLFGRLLNAYAHWLERQVLENSSVVVAVSGFSAEQIATHAPRATQRVVSILNGVDTTFFHSRSDRQQLKTQLGLEPTVPLVIGVGRMVPVKRFERFLETAALLKAEGVAFQAALIGEGPERSRLERASTSLGVADLVRFTGQLNAEQLRAYMQAADVQVCSSVFENRSLAIMEALACGTPVVGTATGGTPELLNAVDTRLLVSEQSASALACPIRWLLSTPAEREALGAHCRQFAVQQLDWERTVDLVDAQLHALVS